MNEREFNIRDGKVIDKAGYLLKLGRITWPVIAVPHPLDPFAFCKSCMHYDACNAIDADNQMYNMTECEHHISVMTPEEFKNEMSKLTEDVDIELRHERMDGLLLKVLRSLGYDEGVDIFVNTKMWYA